MLDQPRLRVLSLDPAKRSAHMLTPSRPSVKIRGTEPKRLFASDIENGIVIAGDVDMSGDFHLDTYLEVDTAYFVSLHHGTYSSVKAPAVRPLDGLIAVSPRAAVTPKGFSYVEHAALGYIDRLHSTAVGDQILMLDLRQPGCAICRITDRPTAEILARSR